MVLLLGGLTRILFIWFVNENIDATYSRAVWPTTHCPSVRPSVCCCLVGRYVEFLCGDIFGMINKLFLLLWIYYSIFHINKNNPKILKLFCFFSLSIAILSKIHLSSSMWKFLRKISLEKIFASFDEAIYSHRTLTPSKYIFGVIFYNSFQERFTDPSWLCVMADAD